ncbi:hypothetical protein BC830DRAFT_1112417 [Chytriomyces sp. MP71]|nr:hypothetical protein BC830DRAFT_1112417 [Chytriomyces sp. MP71]
MGWVFFVAAVRHLPKRYHTLPFLLQHFSPLCHFLFLNLYPKWHMYSNTAARFIHTYYLWVFLVATAGANM